MKTENISNQSIQKPATLRAIFILNALMTILPFVFYFVVTGKGIDVGYNPVWMLYTATGYITSFTLLIYFILNKNLKAIRVITLLNLIMSLPAKAFIGMFVAVISLILTFTAPVKKYFGS